MAREILRSKETHPEFLFGQDEWQRALSELSVLKLTTPRAAGETLSSLISEDEMGAFFTAYENVAFGDKSLLTREFYEGVLHGLAKASSRWKGKESIRLAQDLFRDVSYIWFGVRGEQATRAFQMFRAAYSDKDSPSLQIATVPSIYKARSEGRLRMSGPNNVFWENSSGLTIYNIKGNPVSAILYTQRPEATKRPMEDFTERWTGTNRPSVPPPRGFPGMAV